MQTFSSLSSSRLILIVIPAQAGIQLIQSINLCHLSFRHPGISGPAKLQNFVGDFGRDPVDDICRQPVSFGIITQVLRSAPSPPHRPPESIRLCRKKYKKNFSPTPQKNCPTHQQKRTHPARTAGAHHTPPIQKNT